MRTTLTCLLLASMACGGEENQGAPADETTETQEPQQAVEANAPEVETAYAIHEWGFIAQHYAAGEDELLTSRTVPSPEIVRLLGVGDRSYGFGGKPVIYVHLQGESTNVRFRASLSTAGRFVEEWPHSEGSTPTRLSWDVEARRGSCSAAGNYPVAADEHCGGISDHYCEAAELANYETEDSACLTIAGKQWNHLFYRAEVSGAVPLRVSKSDDTFTVHSSAALPGRLMRIQRTDDASGTHVALFDAPAAGESRTLPSTDMPASVGIAALQAELSALGMSEDETNAFMTAWQPELFGDTPERTQVEMVGRPPLALQPKADALIYFLPMATLDAMVPLDFTPPPAEVRRAVLVRIDLGTATPAHGLGAFDLGESDHGTNGTQGIGLGNLGHIGPSSPANPNYRPPSSMVRVRQRSLDVEGEYSAAVARRIIRRHINEVRLCGDQHLEGAGTEANIELSFDISATGAVRDARVTGGPSALNGCLGAAARRWTFPSPESAAVRVTAPLHFELYAP
ncbi:MAG: AgmX/PglI C-terminal domain-containing protein [Polyangiales bacterium]